MKLKTIDIEGATYAEVADGRPVFVTDDGKEIAFDAPGTRDTIARLNGEAKAQREAKEKAEGALKAFDGLDDPAAARKALQTLKGIDDKKLIDAGEVDKVRAEAIKAVEDKYAPVLAERDLLTASLRQEKIGGSFARSKFIADKLAPPVPMVEATFGRHFTLEDGRTVAKDANGNVIYSKSKPGEVADFDEAMEALVDASPFRDSILKGLGQSGSGAKQGNTGGTAGAKTMTRSHYDALSPMERGAKIAEGVSVVD